MEKQSPCAHGMEEACNISDSLKVKLQEKTCPATDIHNANGVAVPTSNETGVRTNVATRNEGGIS
jgi:hypothetical protein